MLDPHTNSEERGAAAEASNQSPRKLGGIEEVRQLLFGENLSALEKKLVDLEQKIADQGVLFSEQLQNVQVDVRARCQSIEAAQQTAMTGLSQRCEDLRQSHTHLQSELSVTHMHLERHIEQSQADVVRELERISSQLRQDTMSKAELSQLLIQLSQQVQAGG